MQPRLTGTLFSANVLAHNGSGGVTSAAVLAALLLYYALTRRIPSRQRPDQAPRSKFGVVPVDGSRQGLGTQLRRDGVDIVLVHGLGSNPDTTWRARPPSHDATQPRQSKKTDDGVCWVTDLLVDDILPEIRRNTRIFFYNHDSYWQREAVQTRLWNLAGNMLQHIQGRIRQTEEEKSRGLVFVAYSYGGLLVKQALIRAKDVPHHQDIVNRTRGIVFLGTPHRGSSFSVLGSWIAWILRPLGSNELLLNEIKYDSLHLQDLHEQFTQTMGPNLQIYNFFEERRTCLADVGFFQWSEFCVNEQSATYSEASQSVRNVGLAVNHAGLNKFGAPTAEYEAVRDRLVRFLPPPLRKIYSVPPERVETYTARQDLSQKIHKALGATFDSGMAKFDGTVDGFQAVVIHGMGGVGKTQLALNYAEETRGHYNPVFWVNAQTEETVQASFERGAVALGLKLQDPPTAYTESPAVDGVCRWLSERNEGDPQWLVIVDNADDTSLRIDKKIPRGVRGHVIVTSQHKQTPSFLRGSCRFVEAKEMSREEARTLLKKTVCLGVGSEWVQQLDEMGDHCDLIVDQLGCLALAVELAGLYLGEQLSQHSTDTNTMKTEEFYRVFRQYLDDFKRHKDTLLKEKPFQRLSSYEKTIWTAWDTSLAAIETQCPDRHANQMLAFLAQFDRGQMEEEMFRLASVGWRDMIDDLKLSEDDLPDWLQQIITCHDNGWDDFHYRQATQPLVSYGLLRQLDGEWAATAMHSLVQWRARKAGEEMNVAWKRCTLLFLLAAVWLTNRERSSRPFLRYLTAHLLDMNLDHSDLVQELQLDELVTASLGREFGDAFLDDGRWQKAEEWFVQVVEAKKRLLGMTDRTTLWSMHQLASTLLRSGKYEEAEKTLRQVTELRRDTTGIENEDMLRTQNLLALTLSERGKYEEAETMLRETLQVAEEMLGRGNGLTLSLMNSLGSTLFELRKSQEAEKIFRDVLQLQQRRLGNEHLLTLTTMNNLAMVLHSLQQFDEAKSMHQQVLQVREKVLGKEHPLTLTTMNNLAMVLHSLQQFDEAKSMHQQVLQVREKVLGKEHPDALTTMNNLASAFYSIQDFEGARRIWQEALPLMEKALGKEHPNTLICRENLKEVSERQAALETG